MNSENKTPLPTRRLFGSVLAVYWVAIFIATHLSEESKIIEQVSDKTQHWMAYCGLAIFYSLWSLTHRKFSAGWVCRSFLILVGYGIADELLQIPVNRVCDFQDWLADAGGVLMGLGIVILLRKLFPRLWNRLIPSVELNSGKKMNQRE